MTLDKLRAPAESEHLIMTSAQSWWDALKVRYAQSDVVFTAAGLDNGASVPGELFDSVADNLIQNALNKIRGGSAARVEVNFSCGQSPCLHVTDAGAPVPPVVARSLFDAPVPSKTGLGIGLYQAARQAAKHGYKLALAVNEPGQVRFELAPV